MTAPTLPGRQLVYSPVPSSRTEPAGLSTAGWSRLRRSVTSALFVVVTVVAVTIGFRAVDVSPVAPPVAVGQPAIPAAGQPTVSAVTQPAGPATAQPTAPTGEDAGPGPRIGRGTGRGGGRR